MNIAVTLPADAPVGGEPVAMPLSPLRSDLGTVTALYNEWHRIRDAFEPAHDPESDADPFLLSHHLSTVEEALGWTVPTSAEECMMLFEIMYENEKDEFDICDKSSFRDRSTRFILENFLEGKERLKTK